MQVRTFKLLNLVQVLTGERSIFKCKADALSVSQSLSCNVQIDPIGTSNVFFSSSYKLECTFFFSFFWGGGGGGGQLGGWVGGWLAGHLA